MKCSLCEKAIIDYNAGFHHLVIDDTHSVDICPECIDKLMKWQGKILASLFPTKALKKRYGKA
jgi:hypothetical protein